MKSAHKNRLTEQRRPLWPVWMGLILILALTAAARVRLLDIPLERDEGEYAYTGQLILRGIAPYTLACNMKMPGIYAAYAAIMAVLGESIRGIHLGLLAINLVTILSVFFLGRRLLNPYFGLVAAAFFALLSIDERALCFTANAEHFVLVLAVPALLLLLKAVENQKIGGLFLSGLLLGCAFLMKQHAAAFAAFGAAYLAIREISRRPLSPKRSAFRSLVFLCGLSLPFAATCMAMAAAGAFKNFWFWTVDYARHYVSQHTLHQGIVSLCFNFASVAASTSILWTLALAGGPCACLAREGRRQGLWLLGFAVFSFLAICPGLYFREHYFILMLPAVALLAAAAVRGLFLSLKRLWPFPLCLAAVGALVAAAMLQTIYLERRYLFTLTPSQISKQVYGESPFAESLEIARYVQERTSPEDRIAVVGSEPQIYFYANRLSATSQIYTYALMERHPYARVMQEEMISQIEKARPKFLIYINVNGSWMIKWDSLPLILGWVDQYARHNYRLAGIADILPHGPTIFRWGTDAAGYKRRSNAYVLIFERLS